MLTNVPSSTVGVAYPLFPVEEQATEAGETDSLRSGETNFVTIWSGAFGQLRRRRIPR